MSQQYHLSVYAVVEDDGTVSRWGLCEPGSEPVDSDAAVWDDVTETWETGNAGTWATVEAALSARLVPGEPVLRPLSDDSVYTCDWGGCDGEAVAERQDHPALWAGPNLIAEATWLSVCGLHAREVTQ